MKTFEDFIKTMPVEFLTRCNMFPSQVVINFVESLSRGELVEKAPLHLMRQSNTCEFWHQAKGVIGFIAPSLEWAQQIKDIVGDKKVLEVGSGTGLLAKYLYAVGVDIDATDNMSWHKKDKFEEWKLHFPVMDMDFRDAILKYPADYLLLCWAPYEDPLAYEAAKLFHEQNPAGLILCISEGNGGCVANDDFFEATEEVFTPNPDKFPRWFGLYDYLEVRRWKSSEPE